MFHPLKKLFRHFYRKPVKKINTEFKKCFPAAKNVEWTAGFSFDEAIFYLDDHEYIARFDKKANLIDYNINLDITMLPAIVKETGEKYGEIMNAISIHNKSGLTGYEVIYRNEQLVRFTLMIDSVGNVLNINEL